MDVFNQRETIFERRRGWMKNGICASREVKMKDGWTGRGGGGSPIHPFNFPPGLKGFVQEIVNEAVREFKSVFLWMLMCGVNSYWTVNVLVLLEPTFGMFSSQH